MKKEKNYTKKGFTPVEVVKNFFCGKLSLKINNHAGTEKQPKFLTGFTLVEVIIVIAIISILSAISFSMLSNSRATVYATGACNELASLINKTRDYALSGKKGSGGTVPSSFSVAINGASVSIAATGESFTLTGGASCSSGTTTITYSVPNGSCSSGCPATLTCSATGGTSRTVSVDQYKAVCN